MIESAMTNTLVDGPVLSATNFVPIGNSGYWGTRLTMITNGIHRVTSSQPAGVEIYGFGFDDAYGYFGGIVK